ncbi:tetraspanin-1-like [Crassostrea angulata]|uniref:tetraspanin-1-like n=1 Tax=Magallana angulata TaxID=2784310 RepID=UPI0022B0B7DE|nr:tetraspanin-1-like [Crassostrea angulata]
MNLNWGGRFGKVCLITTNFLFTGVGLMLVTVGVLAVRDISIVNKDKIKPLLDSLAVDSFSVGVVNSLSIIIIVVGVFIFFVAGLGIYGAFCQNKYVLVTYVSIVVMLFLTKIVVIALCVTVQNTMEREIKAKMIEVFNKNFIEDTITSNNSLSNTWNCMFMTLDCCGVNPVVSTTNDFDLTYWCTTSGSCEDTISQIPRTCCTNVDENTYTSAPIGCHASVNKGTYNQKGCYDVLKDTLQSQSQSVIGVVVTIILIEIVAVIFAILIYCQIQDS